MTNLFKPDKSHVIEKDFQHNLKYMIFKLHDEQT